MLEFGRGLAVVAVLSADALLIILVRPATNIGSLLFGYERLVFAGGNSFEQPAAKPPTRFRR